LEDEGDLAQRQDRLLHLQISPPIGASAIRMPVIFTSSGVQASTAARIRRS
jgi:hypothetical protein